MAISPQRLTIYLYSAHCAVIFAIAQLSCRITNLTWRTLVTLRMSCPFDPLTTCASRGKDKSCPASTAKPNGTECHDVWAALHNIYRLRAVEGFALAVDCPALLNDPRWRDQQSKTQSSALIDRRAAYVLNRPMALYRTALTMTLHATTSDAECSS